MTAWSDPAIWGIIAALGLGTYAIRFSFLGLLGNRTFPEWVLRHLRYTTVTILPALITPAVLWPEATGGQPDPARLAAAAAALAGGYLTRNAIVAILAGMATLYLVQFAGF